MRNMEAELKEYRFLWEDDNWVLLFLKEPTAQEIKYAIFDMATEEMLLIEDNELADFLKSEMKRRGCRIVDINSLDSNNSSIGPDDFVVKD